MTRKKIILLIVASALLAAYALAGFFAVPRLLRAQLQDFASEHYGRKITVGEIRFNPFTLTLEVSTLSFPDSDGAAMLGCQRLLVDLDVSSLWRRGASFAAIELDRPFTHALIRADGSLNLADLAKPFAAPAGSKPAAESSPARVFIDRMQVTMSALTFEDRTHATPFRAQLSPVSFELRDFSTLAHSAGESGNDYTLQGQSSAGEKFVWNGSFELEPLSSRGHFELTQLQARTLWTYLRDSLAFEIASGTANVAGDYDFAAGTDGMNLKVKVAHVNVADLGIRPPGAAADYVHLAQLGIADTRLDLEKRSVAVGTVTLAGGEVHAWRETDGRINLLELAQPAGANPAPAAAPPPPSQTTPPAVSPWVVSVPDISLSAFKLQLEDRFVKPVAMFSVDPLSLDIKGFSTAPGAALNFTAALALGKTARIDGSGGITTGSAAFHGKIDVSGFDLTALQPYLSSYTQMTLLSGVFGTKLSIDRRDDGVMKISGDTDVTKLHTVDNALRQDFIKADKLQASGIVYSSQPASLKIATIDARAPYMRVIIAPDQSVNLAEVLSAPASAPGPVQTVRHGSPPNPVGNPNPLALSIATVRIADASANFADFWIQPNYAVSIQSLDGSITGLSSAPNSRAKLKLAGKVDRYAPAVIEGDLNLLSASLFTDISMNFKGVDMTSVTPYSGHFAGYRIEKGKLSVDLKYHVENRKLDAQQHFVIDQLQLGERVESPDAVHLPLKIAVALLKDRNGVIDIGLPLTGSLDDPQFRVGPLVWKALVGLLAKIATSPFALLGKLGGGGEDINLVDFAPGSAELDAAAKQKMTALTKAMGERPGLALDVPSSYSPDADGQALVARRLEEKLVHLPGNKPAAANAAAPDPARRFALLSAQFRIDFGADEPLPGGAQALAQLRAKDRDSDALAAANTEIETALLAKEPVSTQELEALGAARAHAIQDALIVGGQIDATRVFVIAANAKPAADGMVRVELALK